MTPSIKITLSLLSSLPFHHLIYPILSTSPPFPFSSFPLVHSLLHLPPCSQFCQAILSISPFQVNLCMFFLRFILLRSFPRIMDYRVIILYFTASIHLWVNPYHIHFSGYRLPYSGCFFFLAPSICRKISRCHCFLPPSSTPLCECTTFSLSILWQRGIEVVSRFWLLQIMLLWT